MTLSVDRSLLGAVAIGALLHALLFLIVLPGASMRSGRLPPPATFFAASPSDDAAALVDEVRTVWSPIMFSLPSGMGFSRELLQKDVRTRLSFSQEVESEQFLRVDSAGAVSDDPIIARDLMVTTDGGKTPGLPDVMALQEIKKPASPRVYVAPELKSRLVGGIVLPPVLNQNFESPWEVRAALSVSEQGMVRHVFLERPLDEPALNQQVLQLLYGLRFKSGEPIEGSIELYSPKTSVKGGGE